MAMAFLWAGGKENEQHCYTDCPLAVPPWGSGAQGTRFLIDWIILACRAAWPSEGAPLDMWDAGSQ